MLTASPTEFSRRFGSISDIFYGFLSVIVKHLDSKMFVIQLSHVLFVLLPYWVYYGKWHIRRGRPCPLTFPTWFSHRSCLYTVQTWKGLSWAHFRTEPLKHALGTNGRWMARHATHRSRTRTHFPHCSLAQTHRPSFFDLHHSPLLSFLQLHLYAHCVE